MASNIPIKLTGDNKSALAAITGVQKGLTNLGSGVDNLNSKMERFTSALVGVGIIAFTKSLLDSANQLKDMSDALDINSARLLEMGVAASGAGINMEGLTNMLARMESNIGAAVDGSGEMQKALTKVGISVSDVNNLKPDQIFNKIAVALSKTTDPFTRARLQTELFGKAARSFDAAGYVANIEKVYGSMDKYTQSTADAARISDSLGMFITLVKAEFLALLQPVIDLFIPMTNIEGSMNRAAVAAKILFGALALFVGAQIINGITSIVGGLKSLASFMGLAATVTKVSTRETILNAGAQTFLEGAIGRVGTATTALFIAQQNLNRAIASGVAEETTLTALRKAESAATLRLAEANLALDKSAKAVGISLGASGVAGAKNVGIFGRVTAALFGISLGITAVIRSFGIIAVALAAATILWEAFGDILTRWAKGAITWVIDKFTALVGWLKKVGSAIREATDAMGLTTPKAKAGEKPVVGATETPANAPSLLTEGAKSSDLGWISKEQSDANKALDETIRKLQEETQLQQVKMDLARQGTFYAETEANIQKTIGEETAKLAKTNQTLSAEKAGQIRDAITQSALLTKQAEISDIIKKSDNEISLLGIRDTKEREIQAQLREVIAKYGKMLNADDLANLDTALRINQAKRDQIAIEEGLDRLRSKNIPKSAENALAGAALAQTDMEKLQATYDLQAEQLKQALDKQLITQEAYTAAWQKIQLEQYNGELDLVIRNFDAKQQLREKEIQAEAAKYAEMLVQQKDFLGQQRFTYEEAKQIALDKARFEKKTDLEKTQYAIQMGADMFNALGAQNKKAFEIAKAFNIANAIMNTYLAATKALAQGGIFGFIGMAAAIAAGFAQVAAIRAQTYSGRALGGPMVGGQSYLVGEKGPEVFTPTTAGTMTPNDKLAGGATNVTFNIVANDTRGFDQLLMERRPLITKIIADAQLERGRRQI